jgi:hypothetical protein
MSWSLKRTWPELGSINLKTDLPTVVFPQPLSPTNPRVSPFRMAKEIPSTARIGVLSEEKIRSLDHGPESKIGHQTSVTISSHKSEIRISKSETISKLECSKLRMPTFGFWSFGFVSNFGFRASSFVSNNNLATECIGCSGLR